MLLTAEDVSHLSTGAHFMACSSDPTALHVYAEMIQRAMAYRELQLIGVEELDPHALVVAVGMVSRGLFITDLPPTGDEFLGCIEAIENRLGQKVAAVFSLAAANINGILPLMVGMQASLPVINSDPMGRVFPLISQTTLNAAGVAIGPISLMGVTGERAVVDAHDPPRAETLVRSLVTELGGWAATAMYPCSPRELQAHGVHGSISRLVDIGQILDSKGSNESKFLRLAGLLGAMRVARGRVNNIEGLSGPADLSQPARPSSITLVDEKTGQILRLEIQNEILLALIDGGVAASVPDIITLLSAEQGTVVSIDQVQVGEVLDVIRVPADPKWYSKAALQLAGPRAFNLPIDLHPRRHHG